MDFEWFQSFSTFFCIILYWPNLPAAFLCFGQKIASAMRELMLHVQGGQPLGGRSETSGSTVPTVVLIGSVKLMMHD